MDRAKAIRELNLAIEALRAEIIVRGETTIIPVGCKKQETCLDWEPLQGEKEEFVKHQLSGETSTIWRNFNLQPNLQQNQVTSKLETDENATSDGEESTMSQPKSKLDCISRQDAIEALMAHFIPQTYTGEQVEQAEKLAQKIMNKVPPVTPTERTGEWIEIPQSDFWKCSYCGDADFPRDFCPNCGAKMGGDTE